MKKKGLVIGISLLFFVLLFSGCQEYFTFDDGTITYVAHPTRVRYNVTYGYRIDASGTGQYEIHYNCDLPEVLLGTISYTIIYTQDYTEEIIGDNTYLQWNISDTSSKHYELGIEGSVESQSYVIADLEGDNALSIQEIALLHPQLVERYCHEQSNGTIPFIDPDNPTIKSLATSLAAQANSNNSLVVAKKLFMWLKQNTDYQTHPLDSTIQPASTTFQKQTGDCDDLSFLYISLCRAVNIPARFVRGVIVEEQNGVVTAVAHAWTEVFVGEAVNGAGWIPVECAGTADDVDVEIHQNFGVEDAGHLRLFIDDGTNESITMILYPLSWVTYSPQRTITPLSFVEINNYTIMDSNELVIDQNGRRFYQ
jgi:transglutaminase-like putative cysteine protease